MKSFEPERAKQLLKSLHERQVKLTMEGYGMSLQRMPVKISKARLIEKSSGWHLFLNFENDEHSLHIYPIIYVEVDSANLFVKTPNSQIVIQDVVNEGQEQMG